MTALSRSSAEGPGPLEGFHPDILVRAAHAAIESGLVDEGLEALAPSAAGVALFTLASALPSGTEQRELGRRVLGRMLGANAETFAAVATAMARSGAKGLAAPAIRARVALLCELPLVHAIDDGPLALALVSRRELAREWVALPATRSLGSRRLAAKILERAAREAGRRAQGGDQNAFRVFASDAVRAAFNMLLADREALVWRYVAVARGLSAAWVPQLRKRIFQSLVDGNSPAEWRRAATSLAAYASVNPEDALEIMDAVIERGLFTYEDPASASSFVWGMPRTLVSEPEVARKMLATVISVTPPEIAEAVGELRFEHGPSKEVLAAEAAALDMLKRDKRKRLGQDDGATALFKDIARDLEAAPRERPVLRDKVAQALDAFATQGAPAAWAKVCEALDTAKASMATLDAVAGSDDAEGTTGELARHTSMEVLRDLDLGLLERNVVADLIKLGPAGEPIRAAESSLDAVRERFAEWIVACETSLDKIATVADRPNQPTLRLRRLRALLHLVDGELGDGADVARTARLSALWLRMVNALLAHFERDPVPIVRRTVLASLARALDALVGLGLCDVADVLLVLAQRIRMTKDFVALAETSAEADLRQSLARYAQFLRETDEAEMANAARLKALQALADDLTSEASARTEGLRAVLTRLRESLLAVAGAGSLRALTSAGASEPDVLAALETSTASLAQMCAGASARIESDTTRTTNVARRPLSAAVSGVLAGGERQPAMGEAIEELTLELPHGIARLVASNLSGFAELPLERRSFVEAPVQVLERLPPWLPARRTIGGFYVVRSLGSGGTASVLIVNRVEDRHDPNAERFALKVPDYNATAARSVSQEQFLRLFREEAAALIMLPNHANVARFVTFDLAARPLPILVMELVEGSTLERVIETRAFDMKRCLKAMDDVLAGLEAMHDVSTGHLDLKPSNVILRKGEQAVLVDFGLAGRKIRPGCGTGPYGAPEVWGLLPDDYTPTPPAADVYSFACLAFEMLTGTILFDAPNEVAQVAMHVAHDGKPEGMARLAENAEVGPLADVLATALRRDPRARPTAAELRREIRSVASMVVDAPWPIVLAPRA